MKMILLPIVVLLWFVAFRTTSALTCYQCTGVMCNDRRDWEMVTCPYGSRRCFSYINSGEQGGRRGRRETVWRQGCTRTDCNEAPGFNSRINCEVCEGDACNGNKQAAFNSGTSGGFSSGGSNSGMGGGGNNGMGGGGSHGNRQGGGSPFKHGSGSRRDSSDYYDGMSGGGSNYNNAHRSASCSFYVLLFSLCAFLTLRW